MYVEVIYLKDKKYLARKRKPVETEIAIPFFNDTVKKLKAKKTECLVSLRNDGHYLINSAIL